MAFSSANDIMSQAMVDATIISPGEAVPAAKAAQVFNKLNDMLESWVLERLMVYAAVLESFSLVAGQNEYSYGDGGDFDSERPIRILNECFIRSGDSDYPVTLKPLDVYRQMRNKSNVARPNLMAYSPEYPLGKVFLYPTPDSVDTIHLKVWKQLVEFSDRTTAVDLPPGYRRAITLNLALELLPGFGKTASAELVALAVGAKKWIKKSNITPVKSLKTPHLSAMASGGRGGDINSGPWGW